jgi:hypothetical protein
MANILVFEDYDGALDIIHLSLSDTPHEIVGEATTLQHAQDFISRMISRDIEVDVLLLDGNLDTNNRPAEFRHVFPLDGTEPTKKSVFGKAKPPQPREVIIPNLERGPGKDARMIKKILETCGVTVPIIGISGDTMAANRVDVDYDLGKTDIISGLVSAIETVISNR